jgi:hypothetical protein
MTVAIAMRIAAQVFVFVFAAKVTQEPLLGAGVAV